LRALRLVRARWRRRQRRGGGSAAARPQHARRDNVHAYVRFARYTSVAAGAAAAGAPVCHFWVGGNASEYHTQQAGCFGTLSITART
jgi:hypothetical protein